MSSRREVDYGGGGGGGTRSQRAPVARGSPSPDAMLQIPVSKSSSSGGTKRPAADSSPPYSKRHMSPGDDDDYKQVSKSSSSRARNGGGGDARQDDGEGGDGDGQDHLRSIYVANVNYQATAEELERLFHTAGTILRITIPYDKMENGRHHPRGFALIEFKRRSAIEAALKLDGTWFMDRQLTVAPKRASNRFVDFRDRLPANPMGGTYRPSFSGGGRGGSRDRDENGHGGGGGGGGRGGGGRRSPDRSRDRSRERGGGGGGDRNRGGGGDRGMDGNGMDNYRVSGGGGGGRRERDGEDFGGGGGKYRRA